MSKTKIRNYFEWSFMAFKLLISVACISTAVYNLCIKDYKGLLALYGIDLILCVSDKPFRWFEIYLTRHVFKSKAFNWWGKYLWWSMQYFLMVIVYGVVYFLIINEIRLVSNSCGYKVVKYCNYILAAKGAIDLLVKFMFSIQLYWVCVATSIFHALGMKYDYDEVAKKKNEAPSPTEVNNMV